MLEEFPYANPSIGALEFAKKNYPELYDAYINSNITNIPADAIAEVATASKMSARPHRLTTRRGRKVKVSNRFRRNKIMALWLLHSTATGHNEHA